jgi:two-component system, OmpR family, sensor histidine kinase VicK
LVKEGDQTPETNSYYVDMVNQNNNDSGRNNDDNIIFDNNNNDDSNRTFVIKGRKRALKEAYTRSLHVRNSYYCVTGNELSKSYKPFIPLLRSQVYQYGGSSLIITNIDKETIPAVRELSKAGAQIRHIDNTSMRRCVIYDGAVAYFSIVEEPEITRSAIKGVEETEGEDLWIASTELSVIQSAKRRFLSDWENAVAAIDRINELQQGKPIEITRIMKDNKEAVNVYRSLAQSTKEECLYLLPSARALIRVKSANILDALVEAAKKRQAKIKILCPIDSENKHIVEGLKNDLLYNYNNNIEFKVSDPTKSTILIIDRAHVFTSELRNNATYDIYEALSLSTYSNSKPTIESYITLFESLWKQKEFADKLKLANEKLKTHDKMQKEFINVAAHELRTPTQSILALANLIAHHPERRDEIMQAILRNASRLQRLTNDILDVTRIESQTLKLNKERFDLNDLIMDIVEGYRNQLEKDNSSLKIPLLYDGNEIDNNNNNESHLLVEADRERISQVISNLLNNAVKFTKEGNISINVLKKIGRKGKEMDIQEEQEVVIVNIKDTGAGIDSEILPRLFTKFASKSDTGGTGLGLFISKSIVEAHGGEMWAKNNVSDERLEKGATFAFSLPI